MKPMSANVRVRLCFAAIALSASTILSAQHDAVPSKGSNPPPANYTAQFPILGAGDGFSGPQGTFAYGPIPTDRPDANLAVGVTHLDGTGYYVQQVNAMYAVFEKNTNIVLQGPIPTHTPWANANPNATVGCAVNPDRDGLVQYDRTYDRWIISGVSGPTDEWCFAVSQSSDPRGAYYVYSLNLGPNFPDYPKLGIWSGGYFVSFNVLQGSSKGSFIGPQVCAIDRAGAVAGTLTASGVECFQLSPSDGHTLLPADEDGVVEPTGFPEYFIGLGNNRLNVWKFQPNFSSPSASDLSGPTAIP